MAEFSTIDGFPEIVVTGVAMTTALATDADGTWKKLLDGQTGIRKLDGLHAELLDAPLRIGAQLLEDFDCELTRVERRRLLFLQKMAIVLGRRVWASAGSPEAEPNRLMVSIGTGMGSTEQMVVWYDDIRKRGMKGVNPLGVLMAMPNSGSAWVGLEHRARAGILTPTSADASGAEAIARAWQHIVLGEADIAICGGIETKIEAVPVAAFGQMGLLSTTDNDPAGACRPFDKDRNGFVFGEAGALLVVETKEHAEARGAPMMARLMGAAITSDGYDVVAPDPTGVRAAHAITKAIQLAGLAPTDIDHVNAHAAGTDLGDRAEANAINKAFGAHRPAVYAPKAALGHSIGAVGAVESILTVLALRDGVIPPTLNLRYLDPEIDLDVVTGEPRTGNYTYAVNNSFGFGGHNVALVFGRCG
ncbi:beta-ketoacyl-[acyl-carrier-protein] synthase II [Mycobacterium sp. 852002-51163_SCH5372311]|uniref:KasA/KasB family beta-ketoacyl-ACP synthase n=1 Tax=Mycobacterium sp. 852002-51163_SCH5372311 TaxID=1834097 RepID=UPI0007FC503F|nr:KasA/KasB family beta-ketoacyl-ACP synthase [Mycobacterium sp. 852002-51163_SCH5372311]OBF80549.1 beta-ketoacyl-[acyl-carrier-protein] synthase II [Mycobacterium sp. 852002-51163_SCH5372311]